MLISKGPAYKESFWAAAPWSVYCTSNGGGCTVLDLGTLASSQVPHWIISSQVVDTIRGSLRQLYIAYFGIHAGRVGSSIMHALIKGDHQGHYIMERTRGQAYL
jgi:hypothetical protein